MAKAEIQAQLDLYAKLFKERNFKGILDVYHKDFQIMLAHTPLISGHAGGLATLEGVHKKGVDSLKIVAVEVEEHGDTAIERGTFAMMTADGTVADKGFTLVVWKKDGGKWKILKDAIVTEVGA